MSVINRMLRDLDARRASSAVPGREAPGGLTRGTASVKSDRATRGAGAWLGRGLPVVLILGLGLAAAWWYGQTPEAPPMPARPPQAAGPAAGPVALPAATVSSAAVPQVATRATAPLGPQQLNQMLDQAATGPQAAGTLLPPVPPASAPQVSPEQTKQITQQLARSMPGGQLALPTQSPGLAHELQQQLAKPAPSLAAPLGRPATLPGGAQPAPVPASPSRAAALHKDSASKTETVMAPASAKPAPVSQTNAVPAQKAPAMEEAKATTAARSPKPAEPLPATNPRQAAALETLAQARNLWNAGSREAALDVMRQAVAVSERALASAPEPTALPAFQTLVRELARMELAQGQVRQVLELLVRLEPLLADQADLWAVRGNAAQRLGQHQESVNAYGMALKLRPGEPRWMLAVAVSLAVQGQLTAAAEQAERARAAGVVNPEVLSYLRQLGVSLR